MLVATAVAAAVAQSSPRPVQIGSFDQPVFATGTPGDPSRLFVVRSVASSTLSDRIGVSPARRRGRSRRFGLRELSARL